MDHKKFKEPLVRLMDSLPDDATGGSCSWRESGMLCSISICETYGYPNWQITLSEYPEIQAQSSGISAQAAS